MLNESQLASGKGSLVVVGTGISVAGQMTIATKSHIENADIVYMGIMNKIGEHVVTNINPNSVSLDDLYQEGKSRAVTYSQMADRIVRLLWKAKRYVWLFMDIQAYLLLPPTKLFDEYKRSA